MSTSASYARRRGGDVEVVLTLVDPLPAGDFFLRLAGDEDAFRVGAVVRPSTTGGTEVRATVPVERVDSRLWKLRLRREGAGLHDLGTKLLVMPQQPVALLPSEAP